MGIRQKLGLPKRGANKRGRRELGLKTWFKKGNICSKQLTDGAAEMVANGDSRGRIQKLAKAGAGGKHPRNTSRDVMRNIGLCKTEPYSSK